MFDERLRELRSRLGSVTDAEQKNVLTADIARLERAMDIEQELRESPNPAGGGRVRVAERRANESDQAFRVRAARELAAVELA
jgi:hypothetical protein